jgi:putative tricarboxylic transport membrane protein
VPGPLLIKENLDIVWAIIWGLVFSNLLASTIGLLAAKLLVRVSFLEVSIIIPVIAAISLTGAFANRGNIIDVLMAVIFGLFGYFMRRNGFPVITLVIGFVLGKLAEVSFFQSIMVSRGDYFVFFKRPLPLTLFLLLIGLLFLPFIRKKRRESL